MKATDRILTAFESVINDLDSLKLSDKVETINTLKRMLHSVSPFKAEPVDCVIWTKGDDIAANDYNPNSVAPPEMKLLELSIKEDGYTQPIVTWKREGIHEVVDGFHRNRVGKESPYAGDIKANTAYARECLADSLRRGEAPLASHLLYTQPGVLDDTKPEERRKGINAGHAWMKHAAAVVVYGDLGISDGMYKGIAKAHKLGVQVEFRRIRS